MCERLFRLVTISSLKNALVEIPKLKTPNLYFELRHRYYNLIGLKNWLWIQYAPKFLTKSANPYDEEFWASTGHADWLGFAKIIVKHTKPKSVLDVGCGSGTLLAALKEYNPDLHLVGLDGSPTSTTLTRQHGLSVFEVDIARNSYTEIEELCAKLGLFDLVLCLEVAEHFPSWHSKKLLKLLTSTAKVIVFSAAHPNQGGTFHVNEQPAEYWIAKFQYLGFRLAAIDNIVHADLQELEIAPWYKANIRVFERL